MSTPTDSDISTLCEQDISPSTSVQNTGNHLATTHDASNESDISGETLSKEYNNKELSKSDHGLGKVPTSKRKIHFRDVHATGPSRRFWPTRVRINVEVEDTDDAIQDEVGGGPGISRATTTLSTSEEVALIWRSRDSRKGRNSVVVRPGLSTSQNVISRWQRVKHKVKHVSIGIWKTCISFMYWDLAWICGWSYSVGSILFVLDGVFAWMPLAYPGMDFGKDTVAFLYFFGALLYQLGATTAYLEAVNDGSFPGSPMRRFLEGHAKDHKKLMDEKVGALFGHVVPVHRKSKKATKALQAKADNIDPELGWNNRDMAEKPEPAYPPGKGPAPRRGGIDLGADVQEGDASPYMTWRWWPTWHCLRTYHVYEVGYIANAIQLPGATLFSIGGVVGLPGVYDKLDKPWKVNAAYWIPQIVGSACFLIAGFLFAFETQEKWYKPELRVLGWWVGFWAFVGSAGFVLSDSLGPASFNNTGCAYQSSLSSMWGSAAYLISSLIQWYEAVNKNPVAELLNEPGKLKSSKIHGL